MESRFLPFAPVDFRKTPEPVPCTRVLSSSSAVEGCDEHDDTDGRIYAYAYYLCICIICIYTLCIYICICIYIERERESEREIDAHIHTTAG